MQHPDRLDDIETPVERPQLENVGLSILDVRYSLSAALPARVSEAGTADVDRENSRPRKSLRRTDRVRASATAGDQNLYA